GEGVEIPLPMLRRWAVAQGGSWSDALVNIPNLEPGTYRVCGPIWVNVPRSCSEGILQIGGTLALAPGRPNEGEKRGSSALY
ncbi:MAG: hypothetical protein AAF725_27940, partial [Acidobacteriota bacterium]